MIDQELLHSLNARLVSHIAPAPTHLDQDRWVLGSLLQKAIRRNEPEWALPATATLLLAESRWLWRRLAVAALEDIAFGDIHLVAQVLAASKHAKSFPDDWHLISYLVGQMCSAPKCRALNDLVEIGAFSPCTRGTLSAFRELNFDDLLFVAGNQTEDILSRYLAAITIALPDDARFRHPELNPNRFLEALRDFRAPAHVNYSIHRGLLDWKLEHSLALAVLGPNFDRTNEYALEDDIFPAVELLKGVPSYAFDMHTRAGSRAIRQFLARSEAVQDALHSVRIDRSAWFPFIKHCMFDLEAGLLRNRLSNDLSRALRKRAEALGFGRTPSNAVAIMGAIRDAWGIYESSRRQTVNWLRD